MKRRRRTLGLALAFCLAALCLTPSALANGWRLRGELVQYVLETNRWDEYTALESQGEHCAVMHTDYHNELLVALDGYDHTTTVTAVLSALNNVGPGLGEVGPMGNYGLFSAVSKLVLSADMLIGRLEIIPLIVLCTPSVWRRR